MNTRQRGRVNNFTNVGVNIEPSLRDRLERFFERNKKVKRTYWYAEAIEEKLDREEILEDA